MEVTSLAALFIAGAVAGFIELVNRIFKHDWEAAIKIFGAGVIGGVAGAFALYGLDVPTGITLGLSASGFITAGQKISDGSSGV